jgi:hypothetical protein
MILEKYTEENVMKIPPVGDEIFYAGVRTDRQTWRSFSQF